MHKYEVKFYTKQDGKVPFLIWLKSVKDNGYRRRIFVRLNRMSEGNLGDYKILGDDLCELRLAFGSGYRIYYSIESEKIVILFVGGDKSTQSKDIDKAYKYLQEHKEKQHGKER